MQVASELPHLPRPLAPGTPPPGTHGTLALKHMSALGAGPVLTSRLTDLLTGATCSSVTWRLFGFASFFFLSFFFFFPFLFFFARFSVCSYL